MNVPGSRLHFSFGFIHGLKGTEQEQSAFDRLHSTHMKMNVGKIIAGGLLAGIILIVINVLAQLVLAERVWNEMNAWVPGSSARLPSGSAAVATGVVLKLVIGVLLVWLYAAIRPRFGPGARTATYAAIVVWILGGILFSDFVLTGMISGTTYVLLEGFQLAGLLLASVVGARMYSEDAPSR